MSARYFFGGFSNVYLFYKTAPQNPNNPANKQTHNKQAIMSNSTATIDVSLGAASMATGDSIYASPSVNSEPDSNITSTSTPLQTTAAGGAAPYWNPTLNSATVDHTAEITASQNVNATLVLETARLVAQKTAVEAYKEAQENMKSLKTASTVSLREMDIISSHLDSDMNIEVQRANLDILKYQHKGMNMRSEAAIANIITNIVQKNSTGFPKPLTRL